MSLRIIADENIPFATEIFSTFGTVTSLPGRKMTNTDVKNADALIIRSVTNVTTHLIQNTSLKFIGTCTIGRDHVNEEDVKNAGIYFCSAPGCNAQSVAEYIVCVLLDYALAKKETLKGKTLGIVGVGNVGSIVARYAEALEMKVVLNDPPRQRTGDSLPFRPFEDVLACDFITLHVPLNKTGADKTHYLINEESLKKMKPNTVLINTCRGSVINNKDLKQALKQKIIAGAILDVWENEPTIDQELFDLCFLGTPHIAGYSFDAKVRGSTMIADELAKFLKQPKPNFANLHAAERTKFTNPAISLHEEESLQAICNLFYNPREDHLLLSQSFRDINPGESFDNLRKKYKKRREFQIVPVEYKSQELSPTLIQKLKQLRFQLLQKDLA